MEVVLCLPYKLKVMEENYQKTPETKPYHPKRNKQLGRILGGLIIVITGSAILLRRAGVEFPAWLFSFEMLIVVVGLYVLARHEFKRPAGLFIMMIGGFLLLDNFIPNLRIGPFIWPLIIIGAGVWMMVSPGRNARHRRFIANKSSVSDETTPTNEGGDDFLNSSTVFGGIKKRYFTKNFKGGQMVCIMGGSEIDLGHADIQEPVTIDVSLVFGGVKLILPSNWEVRSELIAIAGGVEDKRNQPSPADVDGSKILILRGTAIFGGIDIKSY
jgi:predicted membrane protein